MRYLIISVLILLFTILISSVGKSETINVPRDFRTIRSAIEAANIGDKIIVAPDRYQEDIEIKKSITLQGTGTDITILIGSIVVKNVSGVVIDKFTMEGRGQDAHFGIWCSSSSLTISNNTIVGFHHGIGSESSRMVIENNSVIRNFNVGIQIETAISTLIKGNTVADNIDTGIRVAISEDNVIVTDNVITGNRIGIECVQSSPKIRKNAIEGNEIGVLSTQEDGPDMGTDDDPGLNSMKRNGLQIMNMERRYTIQAKHNYWGSSKSPEASSFEGKVDYVPWLEVDPLEVQPVRSRSKLATTWGKLKQGSTKVSF